MSEAAIRRPFGARPVRKKVAADPSLPSARNLYPLQIPLAIVGIGLGLVTTAFIDWAAGLAVFTVFALAGATWRADFPPLIPACIAYQWIFASSGYFWFCFGGGPEVVVDKPELRFTLLLSMFGLAALSAGIRLVLKIFGPLILSRTLRPPTPHRLSRLFWLTIAAFAINYVIYLIPSRIWFGGAQIINTILLLRFVPYFLLAVTVFERGRGYPFLAVATVWVMAPEFLTGFSSFRETLFVVVIAAVAQWRPWIRSKAQSRRNRQIVIVGGLGFVMVAAVGLIWSGGFKDQWRAKIWADNQVAASPVTRMVDFVTTFGHTAVTIDYGQAANNYLGRISSSSYYFALAGRRVPQSLDHEHGKLLMIAINNAITPRILNENKAELGSDSWLVRKYAGVNVSGADSGGTSVAFAYMAEFYVDFGVAGVIGLSFCWGALAGLSAAALAVSTKSRDILVALLIGLFIQSYMGFETSFMKLLGGMILRTGITCIVIFLAGRTFEEWIAPKKRTAAGGPPARGPGPSAIRGSFHPASARLR